MTRYQPLWQQAGSYAASLDRSLIGSLWPAGGATGGVVTAVANTMTVSVAPGTVAVPLQSGQGAALCRWDAAEVVTIGAAPASGQTRIDLICAQVRDNALDSGGNNDFVMIVVPGTAAASNPATPATPTNALALWSITVVGASANLAGATLTDRRPGPLRSGGQPFGRIYQTGSQAISSGWQDITLAGVSHLMGVATTIPATPGGLITPSDGVYRILGVLGSINGPSNALLTGGCNVGVHTVAGTAFQSIVTTTYAGAGSYPALQVVAETFLVAGTEARLQVYLGASAFSDPTNGNVLPCSLSIARISD